VLQFAWPRTEERIEIAMSARQRKRMQQELERQRMLEASEKAGAIDEEGDDEDSVEEDDEQQTSTTVFAFLADDSGSNSDSDSDIGAGPEKEGNATAESKSGQTLEEEEKKTKKKKMKKPSKNKSKEEEAFLEKAIEQARLESQQFQGEEENTIVLTELEKLIAIEDIRDLNPDHEMHRKIGRLEGGTSAKKEVAKQAAHSQKRSRKSHRSFLCTIEENQAFKVPSFVSGHGAARMIRVENEEDGGNDIFLTFETSESYKNADVEYQQVRSSMDPNQIVNFLNHHPIHVPALLQMVAVYLQMSQLEAAEATLRRTLYILEAWVHPRFAEFLREGRCRMAARVDNEVDAALNDIFQNALFRSMLLSRRRGCEVTAFSLCKTLFAFDPRRDRRFMLLILDQLAIEAEQEQFLIGFIRVYNPVCEALPNMMFAKAVALQNLGKEQEASKAAQTAVKRFPQGFTRLVKILDKEAAKKAEPLASNDAMISSAVQSCASRGKEKDTNLDKLYDFMGRIGTSFYSSKMNDNDVNRITWLAFQVTKINWEDPLPDVKNDETRDLEAKIRSHYARVQFSDFSDEVGVLDVVDNDDFGGAAGAGGVVPNVDLNQGMLRLFFETMMPWARMSDRDGESGED